MARQSDRDVSAFSCSDAGRRAAVTVWLAQSGEIGREEQAAWLALLSHEERAHWQILAVPTVRAQYLAGRALVRTALSRHTGVPAHAWCFGAGPRGKPFIAAPQEWRGLRFNLSHSGGLLACAVGRVGRLGIDVEHIRAMPDWPALARRVCSTAEQEQLMQRMPEAQLEHFYTLWTMKEAYGKACGTGLALPMRDIEFEFGPAGASLRPSGQVAVGGHWRFPQFRSRGNYRMALALPLSPEQPLSVTLRPAWDDPAGSAPTWECI